MAISNPTTPYSPRAGDRCFFCGGGLLHPCQYWYGFDAGIIWLHTLCAVKLCRRLLTDAEDVRDRLNAGEFEE
jgi:hypothetical protein